MKETVLKPRHKAFVDAYMTNGRSAAAAYRSISPNCTQKTSEVEGFKYLGIPSVAEYLAQKEAELAENFGIKKEDLLNTLQRIIDDTGDKKSKFYDPKAAIAGVNQMSKMLGFEAAKTSNVNLNDKRDVTNAINEIKNALELSKNADQEPV